MRANPIEEATIEETIDYHLIIENMDVNLFLTDGEGKVLYVNPTYVKNTRIQPEEVLGRYVKDILSEGKLFKGGATMDVIRNKRKCVRLSTVLKSGIPQYGFAAGVPVFDEAGRVYRIVTTSHTLHSFTELTEEYPRFVSMLNDMKTKPIQIINPEDQQESLHAMGGSSYIFDHLSYMIERSASTNATVLITGESGVGKEVLANEINRRSARCSKPFIKVNCAAIPSELLESELFGYEQGSFSGASQNGKMGLFELANKGTLLLDEIGDMPISLQPKLLRAIQNHEITRIGGTKPINLDIRVIALTNGDLQKKITEGSFRRDLYYRLNVIPICVPPLRERVEDIVCLIEHFMKKFSEQYNRHIVLSEEAKNILKIYSWPGNIRELENILEYLTIFAPEDGMIEPGVIQEVLRSSNNLAQDASYTNLSEALGNYEKNLIQKVLDSSKNLREAANTLGIDVSTVSRKIKQHNLRYGNIKD
jgi:transcriptional regulator with PAS, ATPase and Fis domain